MMSRYSAAVCKRGHYREKLLDSYGPGAIVTSSPESESFCSKCGAPVIAACPKCNTRILGASQYGAIPEEPEKFCFNCGAPYPWADRGALIMQLRNLLEFEPGLDDATRLEVAEQIAVLSQPNEDGKKRLRAGKALRELAPKGWQAAQPVLQTLVSAELRKQLGLPLA